VKTLIQRGHVMSFTAGEALNSGDCINVGNVFGVVTTDVASGDVGELAVEGVIQVTKLTGAGSAVAQGEPVNYITASKSATGATPGAGLGYTNIGYAYQAAADGDSTINVKFDGRDATAT